MWRCAELKTTMMKRSRCKSKKQKRRQTRNAGRWGRRDGEKGRRRRKARTDEGRGEKEARVEKAVKDGRIP